jgi:hypothetical protein
MDDGVFDVKTIEELAAEADIGRLEREVRPSLVVDFGHSDTEPEDDEEEIDFPAPDDPPGALAAAPFGVVFSSGGGGDGGDGDGKDGASVLWARCGTKSCNKWRMLLKPLADKKSSFQWKATLVEVGYAPVSCKDSCDNCFDSKCSCN